MKKPLTEEQRARKQEYMRIWRAANPKYLQEWRAKNPLSEARKLVELERSRERYSNLSEERRQSYREKVRENTYGITKTQFEEMQRRQGGLCAICGKNPEGKGHHMDHCHRTGVIRGILCDRCNRGIGFFKDSATSLRKAADYLETHSTGLKVTDLKKANQDAWKRTPKTPKRTK